MSNVVLIIMDDMRRDLFPYMPFVNGTLKRQGTELVNMRCEVPVCSPARAGLLTGRHARDPENGVYAQPDALGDNTKTLPVWLQSVTASNGMFGKYMVNGSSAIQPGWDRWCVMSNSTQSVYGYTCKDETGATVTPGITSNIHQLKYLQSEINTYLASVAEPFFCYFAPTNVHVSDTEFRNNPFPETCTKFWWHRWPYNHLLSDADAATKPSFRYSFSAPQYTEAEMGYLSSEIRNQIREAYDVDGVIQSIYNTVSGRAGGVLGRTTWIFASDSGVFYEEQRQMAGGSIAVSQKGDFYDCCTCTPSFIMGPTIPVGRVTTPMTIQDITPTILGILGGTATTTQRGIDIRTLISSPPADRDTLYECKSTAMPWDATAIVTKDRKLAKFAGKTGNDQYEMYLLDSDPNEYTNVANNPAYLTERNALEVRLNAIP